MPHIISTVLLIYAYGTDADSDSCQEDAYQTQQAQEDPHLACNTCGDSLTMFVFFGQHFNSHSP